MTTTKEAVVIVLDVGPTMGQAQPGFTSPLENSVDCISMLIQRKIFIDPKDEVAVILCGTDQTCNDLAKEANDDDQYQNIAVLRGLTVPDWDLIEELQGINPCDQHADLIDAIVVAMDILNNEISCKKFAMLKLIIFSDLGGEMSDDQIEDISDGVKKFPSKVDVKFISPFSIATHDSGDFRPGSSSSNLHNNHSSFQKPKSKQQVEGEKIFAAFLSGVDGNAATLSEIMPGMKFYHSNKTVRSNPWNVNLTIGENLEIPVSSFKKVSPFTINTWNKTSVGSANVNLATETTYYLNNEEQTEVERDDIISAYCYGSTMVPFLDEDKINMGYPSQPKCLSVLGFTKRSNIKRHHFVGDKVNFLVPQRSDDSAAVALSAIIHALFETDMVAVARSIYGPRSSPKLVLLAPRIKSQFECLVVVQLPFMEDIRQFTFSSLDINKNTIPSSQQLSLIDDLITNMDLMKEDDEESDFQSENVCNPFAQRYYQCLYHRLNHPEDPLPDVPSHLVNIIEPSASLLDSCSSYLESIAKAFPLEVIQKKASEKTGASIFKTDSPAEPDPKRIKLDDNLIGGMATILGEDSQSSNVEESEKPPEYVDVTPKKEEPDEADDLLEMM